MSANDSNDSGGSGDLDFLNLDGEDFGDYGNDVAPWNSSLPDLQPAAPNMMQPPQGRQETHPQTGSFGPMMHPPTMPAAAAMYGNEEMHMYPPAAHSGEYIPRKPMPASKKAAQKTSSKKRPQKETNVASKNARPRLGSKASTSSKDASTSKGRSKNSKKSGVKGKAGTRGKVPEEDPLDDEKREERNLREKERSFKISRQISMLRDLLSSGGVAVPKGTKSSVLTEAANYIRVLQQQRFNGEIERQQFVQKIRLMNSGQMGPQAQAALRQSVLLGLPPPPHPSKMGSAPPNPPSIPDNSSSSGPANADSNDANVAQGPSNLTLSDYNAVFQYSMIPMAIATMGGSFLECNKKFSELSGFPRAVLATMTIFNVVAPTNLQAAFEVVSKMLPPGTTAVQDGAARNETGSLEGLLRHGDCKLSVSLVRDNASSPKYFCVQLVPTEKQLAALNAVRKKAQERQPAPYTATTG